MARPPFVIFLPGKKQGFIPVADCQNNSVLEENITWIYIKGGKVGYIFINGPVPPVSVKLCKL